ncbi:DUF2834 domain-containing protein [Actinoplanes sp. G11-F43]|uniref:DUF2834 domain-containing protein n=1 Tax=Actinoplanes sp. G11-F43 TaxID=3424130 RepID=UPI003D341630
MARRIFYGLAVLGAVVPYAALAVFVSRHGLDPAELVRQAFGSPGAVFFALDVLAGGVVVLAGMAIDTRPVRARWAVVAATLLVGPSCGLPLWLALRR